MTALAQAHAQLAAVLEPLGIEVGAEVLDVWYDRVRHGRDPLPPAKLRELAELAARLAVRLPR
jgi:hypothetical protein